MMEAILFFISLFVISAGAILVAIASILHLAWLAVVIPVLIAAGAAFGLYAQGRRGPRNENRTRGRAETSAKKSQRMAA
ncbi:MAG TPA: hypothetical protein VK746_12215 [Candidatus Eisenbacteria bacterium]|nr:hypothetical protein [Candidatus Eisenbacteria bacterium]